MFHVTRLRLGDPPRAQIYYFSFVGNRTNGGRALARGHLDQDALRSRSVSMPHQRCHLPALANVSHCASGFRDSGTQ